MAVLPKDIQMAAIESMEPDIRQHISDIVSDALKWESIKQKLFRCFPMPFRCLDPVGSSNAGVWRVR